MDFIFDPSLALYLPLYKLDGASFQSKDAYGHLCTVTGAIWRLQGRYFDGTDDLITCTYNAVFDITGEITIEAWIKPPSPVVDGGHLVGNGRDSVDGFNVYLDGISGGKARLRLQYNQSGAKQSCYSLYSITADEWQHYTITRVTTPALFYRNAVVDTGDTGTLVSPASSTRPIKVGAFWNDAYNWTGMIGEIRIYRRALSPLEIQHNYLATKWRYK